MTSNYKFLVGVSLFLISLGIFLGFKYTKAGVGLTIQPVKVSHTIELGESVSGIIRLINASDDVVKVEAKVEDFVPMGGTENYQFVGRAEGVTTVRDWITLDIPESFIFQKDESKSITYTIAAPEDAEPGGHFGVAFFKATRMGPQEGLKVGTRVGMLIFVTVPGQFLQKGQILDFSGPGFVQKGPVNFKIKFENTGTVHFEPKGEITITNIFGKEVAKVPVKGQIVLPTGIRDLKVIWPAGFLLGKYKANASIVDGEGNELTAGNIAFYVIPIWYILGFIAVIIVIFFGLKFLRKKVKISVSLNK